MIKHANWSEIMEQNRDKIIEKIIEAKKETEGTMQGWGVDVEINQEGDVWTTGLMSQNSQTMSSWEGETKSITRVVSWNAEVNEEEAIKYDEKLYAEYLEQKEIREYSYFAYEFMRDYYHGTLREWEENEYDEEIDAYTEQAEEELDRIIYDEEL